MTFLNFVILIIKGTHANGLENETEKMTLDDDDDEEQQQQPKKKKKKKNKD